MEFNEFREKVKEALPDFLTDDLRNAEIKDTAIMNRLADTLVGTLGEREYNGSLSFRLTAPYSEERRETAVCQREQRYYSV